MREMSCLPVAIRDGMTHKVSGGRTIKLNLILKCTCMVFGPYHFFRWILLPILVILTSDYNCKRICKNWKDRNLEVLYSICVRS